jgi:ankyrin repeat protein
MPRFRWVVCQLDALRECLARNVSRVLSQLPKSLDETYLRVLRGTSEANRDDVYRLLQCLVVSMRPLSVEELSEVLAVDFGIDGDNPKLNPDWRWEDQGQALQAACSSLITIVDTYSSRVVQFSHFSVKEFLTSRRLADSSGDVSCYHISLEAAHTTLAQACIGVLLRLDSGAFKESTRKSFPMARYAAKHWVDHTQFGGVSACTRKGIEELFNLGNPHFEAWVRLYDLDTWPLDDSFNSIFVDLPTTDATPLYYATLCGFRGLAGYLVIKYPQHVNVFGGKHGTPLVAALARGDFQMAELLHHHGGDVDVRGWGDITPLLCASYAGYPEIVQWLLDHGADANAEACGWTPLHGATFCGQLAVARLLLHHNANIKAQHSSGLTPLHLASLSGHDDVVRLLLDCAVDVNTRDNDRSTPLHLASGKDENRPMFPFFTRVARPSLEVTRSLLEHGADIEAEDRWGRTALHIASSNGHHDITKLLSEYYSTVPIDTKTTL